MILGPSLDPARSGEQKLKDEKIPSVLKGGSDHSNRCMPGGLWLFGFCLQMQEGAMATTGAGSAAEAFKVTVIPGSQALHGEVLMEGGELCLDIGLVRAG